MEIKIEKTTALMVLKAIRPFAQAIITLADSLETDQPTVPASTMTTVAAPADSIVEAPAQVAVVQEEKPKKVYTLTEVRSRLTQKSRDGYSDQVKALVKKYGEGTLSSVKSENYEDLLLEAQFTCREAITKDEVKARITELKKNGFEKELPALFEHCGATSLKDLAPEHYASFMRDAWRLDHE